VVDDFQRRSRQENKPLEFLIESQQDVIRVMGDTIRIRQVLTNLVGNSYNYTPQSGRVIVRLYAENGKVQVDVADNGIGIRSEDQVRVFERFYRGEDPMVLATAGTGLGLAISKILIEMHHGKIWFSSSGVRGQGSVFSFSLPELHVEE
jgi:two-component system sensor histidine kinase VicK